MVRQRFNPAESEFEKSRKRFLAAVEKAKQKLRFAYSELGIRRPNWIKKPKS